MPNLGGWEWVILAVVALVLFGGTKLAGFGKNAGKAIREFKEETKAGAAEPPAVQAAPPAQAAPTATPVQPVVEEPSTSPTDLR
ncbi:MAG: twin-arginine translocase TatA/TatE family subunit [Propionibacteriaceae bacterium]|jgi:sec-independent protein translocase protein TatA|nr:twin-arginine translocase TatA/TatE family subunit [Propionibacteriaceae bacterium]